MPNWCDNMLTIKVLDEENIAELDRFIEECCIVDLQNTATLNPDISLVFDKVIPYPKKYADADIAYEKGEAEKDGFNSGGYEWRVAHWGTKWEAIHNGSGRLKKELWMNFDTAWSPPIPIVYALIKKYPALSFKLDYSEEGMEFKGSFFGKDGNTKENFDPDEYAELTTSMLIGIRTEKGE